jgi:uncharacterized protein YcbK (DUF882 family)
LDMKVNAYFDRDEFACKCGCGFDAVDAELLQVLTRVREHFAQPITITSGNRCINHNKTVGGEDKGYHPRGMAADFKVAGIPASSVQDYLEAVYSGRYGIGRYPNRTHIDTRSSPARWIKHV